VKLIHDQSTRTYPTIGTVNYTIFALDETSAAYFENLLGDNVEFEFAEAS